MKIKWLKVAGVDITGENMFGEDMSKDLGEVISLDPPDPDNPYWEIRFKDYSIFATDRTSICIENPPESKEDGEKKIKTVTQMR